MKEALGGKRLGSGKSMNVNLRTYNRSTHNLSRGVKTSMAVGVLYPIYTTVGLPGDTFEINTKALARTIPTQGPLFGSFKLQVDWFTCPFRLYQGILHNNPINIGLNMKKVKLPVIELSNFWSTTASEDKSEIANLGFNSSSLLKYLGLSGIGVPIQQYQASPTETLYYRRFQAVPILAYYDIFKNYYANTQEKNAYVITTNAISLSMPVITGIYEPAMIPKKIQTEGEDYNPEAQNGALNGSAINLAGENHFYWRRVWSKGGPWNNFLIIKGVNLSLDAIQVSVKSEDGTAWKTIGSLANMVRRKMFEVVYNSDKMIALQGGASENANGTPKLINDDDILMKLSGMNRYQKESDIHLEPFPLENIDKAREIILNATELDTAFVLNNELDMFPYQTLMTHDSKTKLSFNAAAMNGLVVKTYQSDIFNNFVNSEWIDGTNGIAEITKIDTSNGLNLDALNLAQKVYNMLNRIAVSGGTYQDWQNAVYTGSKITSNETPMYHGSFSAEIMFEEVIASAASGDKVLGDLGGRGKMVEHKGGHVKIRVNEPCMIMAIASLTPRISYSQGNDWYMTEILTMDDLHKPALDGIGFQDIIGEQMAWWDTQIAQDGTISVRHKIAKTTAWQNYMTDVDRNYGDFALLKKAAYMVLDRSYTPKTTIVDGRTVYQGIEDATTYIDPEKYNYAFAYKELAAQNFWLQFQFDIKARRLMSARQIPTM